MSLTVHDSFSVSMERWTRQQRSQSGHSRLIREINPIWKSPFLTKCKLTWLLFFFNLSAGLFCGIHYYFEQGFMEECECDLTACIHVGFLFMRKALGGIELLRPEIHHSWAKTMNLWELILSKKRCNVQLCSCSLVYIPSKGHVHLILYVLQN